eukprot:scaffold2825_cov111-Isochrysis_galbana.AAC.12
MTAMTHRMQDMPLRGASSRRSYLFYSFRSLVQEPRGGGRALLLVSCLFAFLRVAGAESPLQAATRGGRVAATTHDRCARTRDHN